MGQMGRIIKKNKRIVLTLGNRRVDNKMVPLSKVTQEYFESIGFELEASITRNIPKMCIRDSYKASYLIRFRRNVGD